QLSPTISADLPNYSKKIIQNNSLWLDAIKNLQASINLEALEKQYEISQPVLSDMTRSLVDASSSLRVLTESFQSSSDILKSPNFILAGATREIYTTNYALKSLDTQNIEESDTHFISVV